MAHSFTDLVDGGKCPACGAAVQCLMTSCAQMCPPVVRNRRIVGRIRDHEEFVYVGQCENGCELEIKVTREAHARGA